MFEYCFLDKLSCGFSFDVQLILNQHMHSFLFYKQTKILHVEKLSIMFQTLELIFQVS